MDRIRNIRRVANMLSLFWIGFLWSGHTYLKRRNIMIVEVLNPLKKCGRMFAFFYVHPSLVTNIQHTGRFRLRA